MPSHTNKAYLSTASKSPVRALYKLKKVAEFKANILTIHQTIPVNGIASLTLSVEILPTTGDASMMIEEIEQLNGVRYLKILSSDASL